MRTKIFELKICALSQLKNCCERGHQPEWDLLDTGDIDSTIALIQRIPHFPPPNRTQTSPQLDQAIKSWEERNKREEGLFLDPVDGLILNDRTGGFRFNTEGAFARVLECTHQITSIEQVLAHAGCNRESLTTLESHGILYIENNLVLNLVVRTNQRCEV